MEINKKSITETINSLGIGLVLTGVSIEAAYQLNWITDRFAVNPLEAFAAFTSYACTYLCVKQVRFNYVLGVITTAAWAWFFYQANLVGSMLQNIYLVPTLIYGYYVWGKDKTTKPVEHIKLKHIPLYAAATAVTYAGAIGIISSFGGKVPVVEAAILSGSILAQFMLDRKKIETWLIWAVVNVLAIWNYYEQEAYLAALQFVFFLGNTAYGYLNWSASMEKDEYQLDNFVPKSA